MSRHITLRNRIRRLEARRKLARSRSPVIYAVYDVPEAEIVGIQSPLGSVTDREAGEALQTLVYRATGAAGGPRIAFARYEAGALDFVA